MKQAFSKDKSVNFPKLLTQKEVSAIIKKSESWLERKRWEGGGIPYRKIGRRACYEESAVLEWLNSFPVVKSTSEEGGDNVSR
jgi:hypothetical protein